MCWQSEGLHQGPVKELNCESCKATPAEFNKKAVELEMRIAGHPSCLFCALDNKTAYHLYQYCQIISLTITFMFWSIIFSFQ